MRPNIKSVNLVDPSPFLQLRDTFHRASRRKTKGPLPSSPVLFVKLDEMEIAEVSGSGGRLKGRRGLHVVSGKLGKIATHDM
jgi:hypothetical protein